MSSLARARSTLKTATAATTSQTTDDVEAYDAAGAFIYVNVTTDPGAGETLAVQIEAKVPGTAATYIPVSANTAAATPGASCFVYYPGAAETTATSNMQVMSVPVPAVFRVKVTHSASGAWTYTVGYDLIP